MDLSLISATRGGGYKTLLKDVQFDSLTEELNRAGNARFSIPVNPDSEAATKPLISEIQIWNKDTLIWWGVVTERTNEKDLYHVDVASLDYYFEDRVFGDAQRNNLLINANFETGDLTGWQPIGVTANVVNGWGYNTHQLNLDQQGSGEDTFIQQAVQVVGGATYNLSALYHIRTDSDWLGPSIDNRGLYLEVRSLSGELQDVQFFSISAETTRGVYDYATTSVTIPPGLDVMLWVRLYPVRSNNSTVSPSGGIIWTNIKLNADEAEVYTRQDLATVANGIISHAQDSNYGKSNLFISGSTPPTGVTTTRRYEHAEHKTILSAFDDFVDEGICDWSVEWNQSTGWRGFKLHVPSKGAQIDKTIDLNRTSRLSIAERGREVATSIIATGQGSGATRDEATASDVSYVDGLVKEKVISADTDTYYEFLPSIANTKLQQLKRIPFIPEVEGPAEWYSEINTGDRLRIIGYLNGITINKIMRVISKTYSARDETTRLTFNEVR